MVSHTEGYFFRGKQCFRLAQVHYNITSLVALHYTSDNLANLIDVFIINFVAFGVAKALLAAFRFPFRN